MHITGFYSKLTNNNRKVDYGQMELKDNIIETEIYYALKISVCEKCCLYLIHQLPCIFFWRFPTTNTPY